MRYHDWTADDVGTYSDLVYGFLPMDMYYADPRHWHAQLTVQETTGYRLAHWIQHGDRTGYRTPSQVRAFPGDEHYWVVSPRHGLFRTVSERAELCAVPGMALAQVMDHPIRFSIPASEAYAFQVPRDELDRRRPPGAPTHALLDLRSGLGRIVDVLLDELHAQRDHLSDLEFQAVGDRVTELVCMLLAGDLRPPTAQLDQVAGLVRRYVRANVGTDRIGLADAARALGWSPRQVREALRAAGTSYREVRADEALRLARDLLQDPAHAGDSIAEIAHRTGWAPAWFSAAFKDRYGEPPREFRRRRLAERATRPEPDGA